MWTSLTTPSSATDGANSAGFSYVRVPLGATDFSTDSEAFMSAPQMMKELMTDTSQPTAMTIPVETLR